MDSVSRKKALKMTLRAIGTRFVIGIIILVVFLPGCNTSDNTTCHSVKEELDRYEASSGQTVDISLYDPTWFASSSDCFTGPSQQRNCNARCEEFYAEVLEPLLYEDAGVPLVYRNGDS